MATAVKLSQRCKQPTRCNKFRLLIFLNQLYMFRATNSPILRSTFWLNIQLLVQCTDIVAGRQKYRCIVPKAVYTVKKCSWGWSSLSPETCRADSKRSINGICCILLVAYIVVLTVHGLTNIKYNYLFMFFIHVAWRWLFCGAETCSCSWNCCNNNCVSTKRVVIIACCFNPLKHGRMLKLFSIQWSPIQALFCLKVPKFHPIVLLIRLILRWRWVPRIGGIVLTGINQHIRRDNVCEPLCIPQIWHSSELYFIFFSWLAENKLHHLF